MKATTSAILIASVFFALPAMSASGDKYTMTDVEKAACQDDVQKYCNSADQDEDKLLLCMKANRTYLTPKCLSAFDDGLSRRGLR